VRAIIIGAGRGRRLMPTTADTPKCFAQVGGLPILDWILSAFAENGVRRISFIGGYQIDKVRAAYPQFRFHHNAGWDRNNILASLMCAEAEMEEPFICCYSDILFTAEVVRRLLASDADISVVVDTQWRARYAHRTDHPAHDAEKVTARNGLVTRIHREIPEEEAHGEFIGVAKFSAAGAALLREHAARFRRTPAFEEAYLIHLFQAMIEQDVAIAHVDTPGGYMEIDTQQDFELARRFWKG
jgi:choline kinase